MQNFKFYTLTIDGMLNKHIGCVKNGYLKIDGVGEKIKLIKMEFLEQLRPISDNETFNEKKYFSMYNLFFEGRKSKTIYRNVAVLEDISPEKELLNELNSCYNLDISDMIPIFSKFEKFNFLNYEKLHIKFEESKVVVLATTGIELLCKEFDYNPLTDNNKEVFVYLEDLTKHKKIILTKEGILADTKEFLKYKDLSNEDNSIFKIYEDLKKLLIVEENRGNIDVNIVIYKSVFNNTKEIFFDYDSVSNKSKSIEVNVNNILPYGGFKINKKLFKSMLRTCNKGGCEFYQYFDYDKRMILCIKKENIFHLISADVKGEI